MQNLFYYWILGTFFKLHSLFDELMRIIILEVDYYCILQIMSNISIYKNNILLTFWLVTKYKIFTIICSEKVKKLV